MKPSSLGELNELLEALCEERLSPAELTRLEGLVLSDAAAARYYVEYLHLHGNLLWDTAKGVDSVAGVAPHAVEGRSLVTAPKGTIAEGTTVPSRQARPSAGRHERGPRATWAAVACCVVLMASGGWFWRSWNAALPESAGDHVAHSANSAENSTDSEKDRTAVRDPSRAASHSTEPIAFLPGEIDQSSEGGSSVVKNVPNVRNVETVDFAPAPASAEIPSTAIAATSSNPSAPSASVDPQGRRPFETTEAEPGIGESESLVAFIDAQIRSGWEHSEITASPRADDAEWIRRAHLDLIGRIPPVERVERFLKDSRSNKRSLLVDELLDDPGYVRHWTTVWTNLLIGRSTVHSAERVGLQKFLRESIALNRPWRDTVYDLVSAEGSPADNGASGFLLAHLNNEAVPATAITARVLLGTQVQCTQCHNHPFNESRQNQFWELNSFFVQTSEESRPLRDPLSGAMKNQPTLVREEKGGPIFFESRDGLMRAALPKFDGQPIDASPQVNRRGELARLMVEDEKRQVARAFVNRMWEHFLGVAFTRPVDDMGPHNPPTHPAVLERLTAEFVQSGYDVKQLLRWICETEAYQLTSRFGDGNEIDDPAVGNPPLFSRVYVKSMSAEQLYDSLLVATRADAVPPALRVDLDRQRDQWIQQFVIDYGTEENDEATTFDGTIPQALLMMNSELIKAAVNETPGTLLHEVLSRPGAEVDKIRRLSLAALSRYPTSGELTGFRKALRDRASRAPRSKSRETLQSEGMQDIFWALLNSNEFVMVH